MPVTPIEDILGRTCAQCHGPATHAYGDVWLCCDCHAGPGEGVRPRIPEEWAALVDRLNVAADALTAGLGDVRPVRMPGPPVIRAVPPCVVLYGTNPGHSWLFLPDHAREVSRLLAEAADEVDRREGRLPYARP